MQKNELRLLLSGTYINKKNDCNSLEDMYKKIFTTKKYKNIDKQIKYIADNDIKLIDYFCEEYPEQLKNIDYPPTILFVAGELENRELSISIVGTRYPSGYGERVVKYIVPYLTKAGFSIISGMARGIDSLAHKETIKHNGYTVAIVGSGIDVVYPQENKELFKTIKQNGCVISQFPLGTKPLRQNFPIRNKLIAALSKGTVVVEADIKSGSLITARLAEELSKPVFAVPGEIFSKRSKGTNKLISDGAIAFTDIETIMSYFYIELKKELESIKNKTVTALTKQEQSVLDVIVGDISFDELISKTSLDVTQLNDILFDLEIKGIIRRTISNGYEKL